jgi:hypothetical protein
MINSKLVTPHSSLPIFPCLIIYVRINIKLIVLLTSDEIGTVIYSDAQNYTVGFYSRNWATSNRELFTGKISLSN